MVDPAAEDARLAGERALAAKMFPKEWAAALVLTGHKGNNCRARLRKQATYALAIAPLKAAGASCATCCHWKSVPMERGKRHCEAKSDFHGYTITKAEDLCLHFHPGEEIIRQFAQAARKS